MKVIYLKSKMKTNKNWFLMTDPLRSSGNQQQDGGWGSGNSRTREL